MSRGNRGQHCPFVSASWPSKILNLSFIAGWSCHSENLATRSSNLRKNIVRLCLSLAWKSKIRFPSRFENTLHACIYKLQVSRIPSLGPERKFPLIFRWYIRWPITHEWYASRQLLYIANVFSAGQSHLISAIQSNIFLLYVSLTAG